MRYIAGVAAFVMAAGTALPARAAASVYAAANAVARRSVANAPQSFGRTQVASVPRSIFPARDFGRRRPLAPVTASIVLRYNREAELDALVAAQSNRRSPLYRHFLTNAQFNEYFAPTPQQQAYVIATLRAAGLRVTHAFPNRTLLDVAGTSAGVERFFKTEIHSISQDRFGARFANVKPATVPANLAPLVRAISLSNLVIAKTGPRRVTARRLADMQAILPGSGDSEPGRFVVPASTSVEPATAGVIKDSGFESGAFGHGWERCQTQHASPLASITKTRAHSGKHSGFAGSLATNAPEQRDSAGVCQLVRIPPNGILSAYLYQLTNQRSAARSGEDTLLIDTRGRTVAVLASSANDRAGWVRKSFNVGKYAGRELYVYFGVHGDGSRNHHTQQYVDDVSLINVKPAPSPTPTSQPTAMPGPTAMPEPTATPEPTAIPTSSPSSVACGASPDAGPLSNGYGYLATGVADAFDYPVQHGCNGAGTTVAVEMDASLEPGDVASYLSDAGVTQTGTITDVAVDGGPFYSSDNAETSLDVETIAGLAPGTNIRIYDFPDLSDQSIEDGYNQTVSDDLASVANSSFGGCEASDPAFDTTTQAIAEQGAVLGITFVASSGDAGSDECYTGNAPPAPASPAGDPEVVSVGGVNFTESTSGTLLTLTAQGDVTGSGFLSGGGVSTNFPLPSYQSGIAHVIGTGRNQPDVSLPGVGVAVYYGGGSIGEFDGTSWASPCFVALLADAAQLHGNARFGFANQAIYNVFTSTGYSDFTDVTSGSNGAYLAGPGYDQVMGIGAPKGYAFSLAI